MKEWILVVGMLISGTINTIAKKAQNQTSATGLYNESKDFKKPWFQTWVMFLGEFLCFPTVLALFLIQQRRMARDAIPSSLINAETTKHQKQSSFSSSSSASPPSVSSNSNSDSEGKNETTPFISQEENDSEANNDIIDSVENNHKKETENNTNGTVGPVRLTNPFIFLPPAMLDLGGTTLSGIGLLWTTASIYQMLRGSVIVFTALLSFFFLRARLKLSEWLGIVVVVIGLALVGAAAVLQDLNDGFNQKAVLALLGVILNILGQALSATQFVVEEKFIKKRAAHPLQVVGTEGMWGGLVMTLVVFPIVYFLPGKPDQGLREDTIDSFAMLGHNMLLLFLVVAYWLSIAFFNFFSLSVAGQLSALYRTLIDAMRTSIVWTVSLTLYYIPVTQGYGEQWSRWSPMELSGFIIMLIGTLMYKGFLSKATLSKVWNKMQRKEKKLNV
eukprot:gb/GECH01000803.1/.p1 GENE.gb/GECH01000803.1/~~gb/GECH01000803.1/.p1  ORF type:complete len:445 (+),score=113.21 gb/GECH01000803.1/:1-1335(+)